MAVDENGIKLPTRETVAVVLRLVAAVSTIVVGLDQDGVPRVVITGLGVALFVAWTLLARRERRRGGDDFSPAPPSHHA